MMTSLIAAATIFLTVTNQVGHVARGEYVRTTRSHLFLRTTAGDEFSVPYAALPAKERDRVKLAVGAWTPPPAYSDLIKFHQGELKRIDLLEKDGTLTAQEAAERRAGERKSFEGVRQRLIREGRLPAEAPVP